MHRSVVHVAREALAALALALAAGACRSTSSSSPRDVTATRAGPSARSIPSSQPAAPRGQTLLRPPRFADVGGACQVGAHVVVGTSPADLSVFNVVVAANAGGALVAWRTGPNEVSARALDADGRPRGEPHAAALEHPTLLRIAAQPDGSFVLVSSPFCPPGSGVHDTCLAARTFGADGVAREPLATANVGPRELSHPWAVEGPRGAVALLEPSTLEQGTPRLARFEPHSGAASTIALSDVPVTIPAGERARLHGFTVDADGRAVAVVRSVDGDVLLREGAAPQPVSGLPRVERLALAVDEGAVVAALLEPAATPRALAVRLSDPRAPVATSTQRGSPLPPPFDTVAMRADVGMGGCLHVERSLTAWGALDDSVTHVWDCRDSDRPPAGRGVAWTGRGFLVAHARHAEGRWIVRVTPVTCAGPGR